VATAILLSLGYKAIELLTYVEYLFAQGRKAFLPNGKKAFGLGQKRKKL